jgi:hypothetical protein
VTSLDKVFPIEVAVALCKEAVVDLQDVNIIASKAMITNDNFLIILGF